MKYNFIKYVSEDKSLRFKSEKNDLDEITIPCSIQLNGILNGTPKTVDINKDINDYIVGRFINPFLNAQNDVFKIKLEIQNSEKTVGYIFSSASLLNDDEEDEPQFDEFKQAFKYYCLRHIIEQYSWKDISDKYSVDLQTILSEDASYLVLFKPMLKDDEFKLSYLYPSLAYYGYYNFPKKSKPNVLKLIGDYKVELEKLIEQKFTYIKSQDSLKLKQIQSIEIDNNLILLLYEKYLVEADNHLYRFLLLYQVIEYLVEKKFLSDLNVLIADRSKYNTNCFYEKILKLKETRSTINKIFSEAKISVDDEVIYVLKSFILSSNSGYEKQSIGDCFYDIRNLLFHDYKSLINSNEKDTEIGLVITCEKLIHDLVLKLEDK